jgi:hypothetical protein
MFGSRPGKRAGPFSRRHVKNFTASLRRPYGIAPYNCGVIKQTQTHRAMYKISTTTACHTIQGTVENHTATLVKMIFDTYEAAANAACEYANEYGAFYVKPAGEAPKLKEGQTYVEVVIA